MPPPWYYVVWIFKTFSEVRGGISGQMPLSLMMAFSCPIPKPLPLATIWREDLFGARE